MLCMRKTVQMLLYIQVRQMNMFNVLSSQHQLSENRGGTFAQVQNAESAAKCGWR